MPEEPWLKTCHRLPDDPAVISIAKETTLDQDTVVGKLLRAWIWADQNLIDGHAPGVTGKWLDDYVSCDGFAQAMANVRPDPWLRLLPDGIVFPKFEKHMGSTAKNRATATVRQQRHRAGLSRCKRDKSATRGEESRVEEKISPPTPPKKSRPKRDFWEEAIAAMTGHCLKTAAFEAAWIEWIGHQRERGKLPTPRAVAGQIREAEGWGEVRAIAAIRHSIAKSYQGLFEPKGTKPDSPARAKPPPGKWAER